MKPSFIAAAALFAALAGGAFAQTPPDIVAALDTNHDGAISRTEYTAMVEARFAHADANHDGRLTGDERSNHHGQPGPEQTQAEFSAQALGVFDGEDTNHDGAINGDEVGRFRAHIAGGSQPRPAH